jgi:hypothetical protein
MYNMRGIIRIDDYGTCEPSRLDDLSLPAAAVIVCILEGIYRIRLFRIIRSIGDVNPTVLVNGYGTAIHIMEINGFGTPPLAVRPGVNEGVLRVRQLPEHDMQVARGINGHSRFRIATPNASLLPLQF